MKTTCGFASLRSPRTPFPHARGRATGVALAAVLALAPLGAAPTAAAHTNPTAVVRAADAAELSTAENLSAEGGPIGITLAVLASALSFLTLAVGVLGFALQLGAINRHNVPPLVGDLLRFP